MAEASKVKKSKRETPCQPDILVAQLKSLKEENKKLKDEIKRLKWSLNEQD
jgi:cell division protein FtsB